MTVQPSKAWSYAGHPYLSGKILGKRLNIPELGLSPLGLKPEGTWEPADESILKIQLKECEGY